jgi:ribosomal protein L33
MKAYVLPAVPGAAEGAIAGVAVGKTAGVPLPVSGVPRGTVPTLFDPQAESKPNRTSKKANKTGKNRLSINKYSPRISASTSICRYDAAEMVGYCSSYTIIYQPTMSGTRVA